MSYELTVVIPTFNEKGNIRKLHQLLVSALSNVSWEAVFVDDDSTDGTAIEVQELAKSFGNIRLIRRIGRRGLSSACIEGMMSSISPFIAVMDADLQHDEKLLPEMVKLLQRQEADVVVGSRYMSGASTGDLAEQRVAISKFASRLSKAILKVEITDPMSGLFMITQKTRNDVAHSLSGIGYKILLDILINGTQLRVKELPYSMRGRETGDSKLDLMVSFEFFQLLIESTIGKIIPTKFILFVAVGSVGIFVHMAVLGVFIEIFQVKFLYSQAIATITAMTGNFYLNNLFTYRDRRLKGIAVAKGLISFAAACSVGALINLAISDSLNLRGIHWLFAGMAGAFVGAIWNYTITSMFTWGRRRTQ